MGNLTGKIKIHTEEKRSNFVTFEGTNFKTFTAFANKDTAELFAEELRTFSSVYDLTTANVKIDAVPLDEENDDDTLIPAIIINHSKGSYEFPFYDDNTIDEIFSAFLFVKDLVQYARIKAAQVEKKALIDRHKDWGIEGIFLQ